MPTGGLFFKEHDIAAWKEELSEQYPEMKGKKLVLYAPTFRGEEEHDKKLLEAFDFDAFQKELGEDHVYPQGLAKELMDNVGPFVLPSNVGRHIHMLVKKHGR